MCCIGFEKRFISFILALSLGLLVAGVLQKKSSNIIQKKEIPGNKVFYPNEGSGTSGCCDIGDSDKNSPKNPPKTLSSEIKPLGIISKPRAFFTDQARQNNTQGKVVLRVTFLADGEIGAITPISSLSDGLTEQAIAAAKGIKFEPAKQNGIPRTVMRLVEYNFTIY